jgi:hypothetical protein
MLNTDSNIGLKRIHVPQCIASAFILTFAFSLTMSEARAQVPACKPPAYTFVTLRAPFPGVDQTLAYGINDLESVVGDYHDSAGSHGFVLDGSTYTPINVPFSGGQDTVAFGINIFRQIVGAYTVAGITHGFLLSNGSYTSIDYPSSGVIATFPRAINALGQIAGFYFDAAGSHGFLLSQGKFTAINFAGASWTQALGINDRSERVGTYGTSDSRIHGFGRTAAGSMEGFDLPPTGSVQTLAYALNNREQIAGSNFLYDSGVLFTLTELNPSAVNASVIGANDLGQLVGVYGGSPENGFLMKPK